MARTRAVRHSADDEASQRSKRKSANSNGEALETFFPGPGANEGKKGPLYHCNYCNKDISGKIRIKCSKCPDFDLCVECFSVGAEVNPHKSNHPYRVMESNLSFPLICPDWNADEEILLLEGIEMYGLGNWAEVAEHVGTKSKAQCIDHYDTAYMNSPCYPLPEMSHVNGKSRKELLAMAKVQGENKKVVGTSLPGDMTPKEESPFSPPRFKIEDLGEASGGQLPSTLAAGASKKAAKIGQLKDNFVAPKLEDPHVNRSIGVKKPKYSGSEEASMTELSGYNAKRQEFDPEYDNDAEQALAEMEFKETDSETERELKLRMLRIYLSRIDERKRRKNFILERKLHYPNPLEEDLCDEDREVYNRYKVFMRFLSQEDYEELVKSAIEENRTRRRIKELEECRAAGCRTMAQVKVYIEQKHKKEMEANTLKSKENVQVLSGSKVVQEASRALNKEKAESDGSPRNTFDSHKVKGGMGLDSGGQNSAGQGSMKSSDGWDITGLPGAEFLSEKEHQFCCQNRLLPGRFLRMQEVLVQEILKGNVAKTTDAHGLFKVDSLIVDKVYDMVLKKLGQQEDSPAI